MVAEVVADVDIPVNIGGSTVSAGTPSVSAGTPIKSVAHASITRKKKKKKNANALDQVVTKRARTKNYGDDDDSEDFSMNSYFKMMMVERQNERK